MAVLSVIEYQKTINKAIFNITKAINKVINVYFCILLSKDA